MFQHTAARRRLECFCFIIIKNLLFQHTAARRRLALQLRNKVKFYLVSTHSRPKAAGSTAYHYNHTSHSFNTQPPEGGWQARLNIRFARHRFNTQPPEGGWAQVFRLMVQSNGFNTQPPEGGWVLFRVPLLNC